MKPLLGIAFLSLMSTAFAAEPSADFHDRLGIQLWSLRAQFKTDGGAALDIAKNNGLREVEAYAGTGLTPSQLADEAKKRGLEIVSCHYGYDAIKKDQPGVIREIKALGAKYVFIAYLDKFKGITAEGARALAAEFNTIGEAFKKEGIRFGLHNHGFEFKPVGPNGEPAYDVFLRATNPDLVYFELDVFWALHAGQDPAKLIEKYPGRIVALHVKDMRKEAVTGLSIGSAPPTDNVAVGTGQMNWPAILSAAQKAGVRFYFLEDETPSPLQCIPDSVRYLRALKL